MENGMEVARAIGDLQGRVAALEDYQNKQNGALIRLADRVDGLKSQFLVILGGLVVNLVLLAISLATRK